jgi:hypothetical protein
MGSETEFTRRMAAAGYPAWFSERPQVKHRIRKHQVGEDYVMMKAWRFGRGASSARERPGRFVEWLGVPRWMLLRFVLELSAWAGAALVR